MTEELDIEELSRSGLLSTQVLAAHVLAMLGRQDGHAVLDVITGTDFNAKYDHISGHGFFCLTHGHVLEDDEGNTKVYGTPICEEGVHISKKAKLDLDNDKTFFCKICRDGPNCSSCPSLQGIQECHHCSKRVCLNCSYTCDDCGVRLDCPCNHFKCSYCNLNLCRHCKLNLEADPGQCPYEMCQVQWCDCNKAAADAPCSCSSCGVYHCKDRVSLCPCDPERLQQEEMDNGEEEEEEWD